MNEILGETERIYIRRMTPDDTDLIVNWRNRDAVRNNFFFRETFTRQMHENWIREKIDTGQVEQFIVCMKDNDRPIGSSFLKDIDRQEKTAEYGLFIGEDDARGKGLGYEILCATMCFALETLRLHKVMVRVMSTNIASISVLKKYGYVVDKTVAGVPCSDGTLVDMVLMSYQKDS